MKEITSLFRWTACYAARFALELSRDSKYSLQPQKVTITTPRSGDVPAQDAPQFIGASRLLWT